MTDNAESVRVKPTYWPHPDGGCWVDAWNGHYDTEADAREASLIAQEHGVYSAPVLEYGEGFLAEDEYERRYGRRTLAPLCGELLFNNDGVAVAYCAAPYGTEHDHDNAPAAALPDGTHEAAVWALGGEVVLVRLVVSGDVPTTETT